LILFLRNGIPAFRKNKRSSGSIVFASRLDGRNRLKEPLQPFAMLEPIE
jgi:hypothetical protein